MALPTKRIEKSCHPERSATGAQSKDLRTDWTHDRKPNAKIPPRAVLGRDDRGYLFFSMEEGADGAFGGLDAALEKAGLTAAPSI